MIPMTSSFLLDDLVESHNHGQRRGVYSICSAHPFVIHTSLKHANQLQTPLLIESTCNQVNQYGGYTGQTPQAFMAMLRRFAAEHEFPAERLVAGGDHLGPNVWKGEPAAQAMDKARVLIRDYVEAGFVKIHLDTSMKCADDPADAPLPVEVIAERAAQLAAVAEQTYERARPTPTAPRYVIGTEVPPPGGIVDHDAPIRVTPTAEVRETIEATRNAFSRHGLDAAWERVRAVVVQPGVEYGDQTIHDYDPEQAIDLSAFIEDYPKLVYEAHSTDYQLPEALAALVQDHFAILKVGPALTFAFREGVFALSLIERALCHEPSGVQARLEEAMLANPGYWQPYYTGDAHSQSLARRYSLSDRLRYYWATPAVQESFAALLANLQGQPIPLSLLSQYLPVQYQRVRAGTLPNSPQAVLEDKIAEVLSDYAQACT